MSIYCTSVRQPAVILASISLVLWIVSTASPYWCNESGGDLHYGPFITCYNGSCYKVSTSQSYIKTIQAFQIIALVFNFLAFVLMMSAFRNNSASAFKQSVPSFYFISAVCGIVAMSVWFAKVPQTSVGFALIVQVVAWLMDFGLLFYCSSRLSTDVNQFQNLGVFQPPQPMAYYATAAPVGQQPQNYYQPPQPQAQPGQAYAVVGVPAYGAAPPTYGAAPATYGAAPAAYGAAPAAYGTAPSAYGTAPGAAPAAYPAAYGAAPAAYGAAPAAYGAAPAAYGAGPAAYGAAPAGYYGAPAGYTSN